MGASLLACADCPPNQDPHIVTVVCAVYARLRAQSAIVFTGIQSEPVQKGWRPATDKASQTRAYPERLLVSTEVLLICLRNRARLDQLKLWDRRRICRSCACVGSIILLPCIFSRTKSCSAAQTYMPMTSALVFIRFVMCDSRSEMPNTAFPTSMH